jgi:hypothetical protein
MGRGENILNEPFINKMVGLGKINMEYKDNALLKQKEELKIKLKMVFGEEIKDFIFANNYQMQLVFEYGKRGLDFEKSLKAAKHHLDIRIKYTRIGINFDDEDIFDIVNGNFRFS